MQTYGKVAPRIGASKGIVGRAMVKPVKVLAPKMKGGKSSGVKGRYR